MAHTDYLRSSADGDKGSGAQLVTAADVRGFDPGDGRISTPSAERAPARSAGAPAGLPPLAPDHRSPEPARSEPARSEPARSEPARSEPARSEPARSEPARSEPARSEPAGPSLPGPSLPGPSLPGPSLPGPSLPGPSLPGPSLPGPSLPGPSLPGPNLPGPNLPGPNLARSEPTRSEPAWSEVVEHFREGLIICDADGVVGHVSPVAERLLPEVTPGRRLAAAGIPGLTEVAIDPDGFGHHGRRLRIRQVPLSGSRSCLYVEDVTDSICRADALLAERARSAFLAVVGEKLGNPLHPDRAAAAVVRLTVPTLAEVAVLVLAPRAGRARWWRATRADHESPTVDSGVLPAAALPPAIAEGLSGVEPHAVDWLVEQAVEAGWLPGLTARVPALDIRISALKLSSKGYCYVCSISILWQ